MENKKDYFLGIGILISVFIILGVWLYTAKFEIYSGDAAFNSELENMVIPAEGVVLPLVWGDLGSKLVEAGVIDRKKFLGFYSDQGDLSKEAALLLDGLNNGKLKITGENSGLILNLLWALGLGNKNEILEKGPMSDPQFRNPGVFASTGGWTLAVGGVMQHYGRHPFIILTSEQQKLVEEVSKNIYRPCCNNPAYFPDCNHGMAMLGLLELMASQGVSKEEMYIAALQANAYWFPDSYLVIARYLFSKGIDWKNADPKGILGYDFSSASGYQEILSRLAPQERENGGSCGV